MNEATANGTNETLAVTEDDTARIIALSVTLPLLGGLLLAFIVLFARLEVRRRRRKHRHSLQTIRLVQSYLICVNHACAYSMYNLILYI